jgi:hypothetical protein
VTGSKFGTLTKPKSPLLMTLWHNILLPELDALVQEGGLCEGVIVAHQEDNAGPHIDKTCKDWLQGELDRRGWKLAHHG